jgi:hypothetical protein
MCEFALELPPPEYNPERAKQFLKEAGASIMASATPFFFCATQKHIAGKIV